LNISPLLLDMVMKLVQSIMLTAFSFISYNLRIPVKRTLNTLKLNSSHKPKILVGLEYVAALMVALVPIIKTNYLVFLYSSRWSDLVVILMNMAIIIDFIPQFSFRNKICKEKRDNFTSQNYEALFWLVYTLLFCDFRIEILSVFIRLMLVIRLSYQILRVFFWLCQIIDSNTDSLAILEYVEPSTIFSTPKPRKGVRDY